MNQSGQANIIFLILLPFLLAICVVGFSSAMSIYWSEKSLYYCRKESLGFQKAHKEAIEEIKKINPIAEALRNGQKLGVLSGPFKIITQVSIQEARMIFAAYQKNLLMSLNMQLVQNQNAKLNQLKNACPFISNLKMDNRSKLEVEAKPKNNLTPSYYESKNIDELSTFRMSWDLDLLQLLPNFIISFLDQKNTSSFRVQLNCSSHLLKPCTLGDIKCHSQDLDFKLSSLSKIESLKIAVKQYLSLFSFAVF